MNTDPLLGKRLANFQLQRLLGRGGMASVYYAEDVKLHRPVAIKVIDSRYQGDLAFAKRFVDEARMIASWRHEHIIHVYYADKVGDLYFFAMEYVDGMSLAELMEDYTATGELMPHDDVLVIGRAIASALDYAHNKKVIHRDVKPSNVLIGQDSRVVLADFGLALDVQQGTIGEVFGTPHYISPEQARSSADAVPQSDLYALGVILYEMFTGSVPFDDPSAATLALLHLTTPPPKPCSINPELNSTTEDVLLKALAKNPEDRYQTGAALLNALEGALKTPTPDVSAELPLPPAAARQTISRKISHMSVFDKIALHLEDRDSPLEFTALESEQRSPTTAPARVSRKQLADKPTTQRKNGLLIGAVVAIAVVATVIGIAVLSSKGDGGTIPTLIPQSTTSATGSELAATEVNTDRPTESPTITPVVLETDAPATSTEIPLPTDTVQLTATPMQLTNTAMPTFTPIPTETPLPTDLPQPTETPAPTILYPSGRRVILFYDDYSFYVWNTTGESIRVSPLRFEALNANGDILRYAFDGSRWAAFFGRVENNRCDALEIGRAPSVLRPAECRYYNAVINPESNDDMVFWTVREGSVAFRVLWENQEVARCAIGIGICEIFLP